MGYKTTYEYDDYRRCTKLVEDLNAPSWDGSGTVVDRTWNWIYDRYSPNGTYHPSSSHTSKEWRVQIGPAFNPGGERRMTARTFDLNNRMTSEQSGWIQPPGAIGPDNPWHSSPDAETHYFTYDANGQKSSYTDPRGRLTTYEYNNRNRLIKTNETVNTVPRTTITDYDPAGNKTMVTFPDNRTQQWLNYDAFGQPRQFIDERGDITDLSYWPWGPMKKLGQVITHRVKDNGQMENQLTEFFYDLTGRPQRTNFPDGTFEQTDYLHEQVSAWHNRKGKVKTITSYDARGRELAHVWSDGTPGVNRSWDVAGRMTSISNMFSVINYTYDKAAQVITESTTVTGSGAAKQVSYCRYPSGEVSQITYPNGSTVVNRFYTARGQLQSVGWGAGATSYVYWPDGKVNYQANTNQTTTTFGYDQRGMIGSVSHTNSSGQNLASRTYWRDNRDRITAWKRGSNGPNGMENGLGDRYAYDEEGQLTSASYRAVNPETTASNPLRSDIFSYDALGNRKGSNYVASRGAFLNFTRRDNGLNEYLMWSSNAAVYYDDSWGSPPAPSPSAPWIPPGNGVTMADGWITASYNALNQPVAMGTPAFGNTFLWFGYDPLGRCVKRWMGDGTGNPAGSAPPTYLYYDGWNLVQEGITANNVARQYVHGGRADEIVASQAGGVWNFHHYDARGHCILLTSTSAIIVEQYDYDAFGMPYFYDRFSNNIHSSGFGNRFLFTGREWLGDLKLYDFRNRMYQPELGRFLQPDPKEFGAGDYNLYRYCHNDPVNKSDPTGLAERLLEDFQWRNARFADSSNNGPGRYAEYANTAEYAKAAQAKVSAFNKSHKGWNAHFEMTHPSSSEFRQGQAATTLWDASSTVTGQNGTIATTSANLNLTTRWNDAAPAAVQRFALREGTGEIAHVTDALKYVSQSGSYLDRGGWSVVERKVPAGSVSFGQTSRQIIGSNMSTVDAERQLNDTLKDWATGSMAVSHDYWDNSGRHTPNIFSGP